ncbi:MAG: class I SAM-dependent DNA methyltransferase [Kiritimatiellaeota bacterium]|nr:class I SAM-dependent DNA methyltransferase [Kiritimatiellota bacterium]
MATGGDFGLESIRHFNGNLFDDRTVLDLTADEMKRIAAAAELDWSAVDPSIFGTLFERGLDPAKRSQLGAHFTSRADIELVVDAVVVAVLRREWDESRQIINNLLATGRKTKADAKTPAKTLNAAAMKKARGEAGSILHRFLYHLQHVRILDPACGSGNFLYVALIRLKDLEKEAILFANLNGLGTFLPMVGPWQLYGIEINSYAHDLAQMTVWIGWLQWIRANGFGTPADPILRPLSENIRLMDAILADGGLPVAPPACADTADRGTAQAGEPANREPVEPDWPTVDYIIGNPPFLGSRFMRGELSEDYCKRLFRLYQDRLGGRPDLCCYWFEKACAHVAAGKCKRAGLLATQGIRGGTNRKVLQRIKDKGSIFWAMTDRPWMLDGAVVHVSMIAFDMGEETTRTLDGVAVPTINANLTGGTDVTAADARTENQGIAFQGNIKRGSFDLPPEASFDLLTCGGNPHGRPNSDVMFPYVNASDLSTKGRGVWIIDFARMPENEAMQYERPFAHVRTVVQPERIATEDPEAIKTWWMHWRTRPELTAAIAPLPRFITTPRVSKHRLFCWLTPPVYPDCAIVVFARADDYSFGVLHSHTHEVWALSQGTQLRERESGFRYTPTTCFETFPFPEAHGEADAAIAAAAKELNERRETWLNPPDWMRTEVMEFPGTVGGPWDRYIDPATVTDRGAFKVGTVRYPRLVARDADCAARLKDRTLTKLYNERPPWLADCHARLDAAVAAAYGWPADLADEAILERLLALNQAAAG